MNNVTTLTHHTNWCTEHEHDANQCVSPAIQAGDAHCFVWLVKEPDADQPHIFVDAPPTGADLTLDQAGDLGDALTELRRAALTDTAVRS